jgi:hypothetical protein
MITNLNSSFKTYDNGRTYSGTIINDKVKLQATVYYNGEHTIVENTLLNASIPLDLKDIYIERQGNHIYLMAAKCLLAN